MPMPFVIAKLEGIRVTDLQDNRFMLYIDWDVIRIKRVLESATP
jgi:hypothetical protein